MNPILALDPVPGVDPFVGVVIAALALALVTVAAIVMRMATRGLAREVEAAKIQTHDADVVEANTEALQANTAMLQRVAELMRK